jgi:hypothetical protein
MAFLETFLDVCRRLQLDADDVTEVRRAGAELFMKTARTLTPEAMEEYKSTGPIRVHVEMPGGQSFTLDPGGRA